MKTITDYYAKDHDRLDGIFKEFQSSKKKDIDTTRKLYHEFRVGLQRHIVWEEEILFPLFEEKTGMTGRGPTEVMRNEHAQIGSFLDAIRDRLLKGDTATDDLESGLLQVLKMHNDKEETILYPMIDRVTSEEEKERIFKQMESLPPEKYSVCCPRHHA